MRFHLPALPGQPVTRQNSTCAFTQKIVGFARMMVPRGHQVFIYGQPGGERKTGAILVNTYPKLEKPPKFSAGAWREYNLRAVMEIDKHAKPGDFICLTAGTSQELVATASDLTSVEYGIGHGGSFAEYRVFESYAWMHATYGAEVSEPNLIEPRWYDAVIPGYFDPADFTFDPEDRDDYLLFMGRLMPSKGPHIAEQIARMTGRPLIICGPDCGYEPEFGKNLGVVGPKKRASLLAKAHALIAPTTYCEPFGNIVVEAAMSGTPVLTTDWGAFAETNVHGLTGYRCRTLGEFMWATGAVADLDRKAIRDHAVANYSFDAVAPTYEAYFELVADRRDGGGWNSGLSALPVAKRGTVRAD